MKTADILRYSDSGGGAGALTLNDGNYSTEVVDPLNAATSITLSNAGTFTAVGDDGETYPWLTGGSPSAYEVLVTTLSGTVSTGTVGSWLPLSSNQTWAVLRTTVGAKATTVLVEIGLLGTSTGLASATISMTATVTA